MSQNVWEQPGVFGNPREPEPSADGLPFQRWTGHSNLASDASMYPNGLQILFVVLLELGAGLGPFPKDGVMGPRAEQAAVCTRQEKNQALPCVPTGGGDPRLLRGGQIPDVPRQLQKLGQTPLRICVGIFDVLGPWLSPKDTHTPHFFLMRW